MLEPPKNKYRTIRITYILRLNVLMISSCKWEICETYSISGLDLLHTSTKTFLAHALCWFGLSFLLVVSWMELLSLRNRTHTTSERKWETAGKLDRLFDAMLFLCYEAADLALIKLNLSKGSEQLLPLEFGSSA